MDGQATCASCGTLFLADIGRCPACGMPADETQAALTVPIAEQPWAGPGARQISTAGRAALLAVNLALLVVFIALSASEFVLPPPAHHSPAIPAVTQTATATPPAEATIPPDIGGVPPAPTATRTGRTSGGGPAPTATLQPTATSTPSAPAPTATLVMPTPTATKNPGGG